MSSQMSYQFEINFQQQIINPNKLLNSQYKNNSYCALSFIQQQDDGRQILELQTIMKTQYLLLEYEQKRKCQRMKQIQYSYINAYNNFLWSKPRLQSNNMIIVNHKDLLQIHDNLSNELEMYKNIYYKIQIQKTLFELKDIGYINTFDKPSNSFLIDFSNYFPNWHQNITTIIQNQINRSQKIQNVFQSQYSFQSRILASLRQNAQIQRFCLKIFKPVIKQFQEIKQDLMVDFSLIYQKWYQTIQKKAILKAFFQQNDKTSKSLSYQLNILLSENNNQQIIQKLILQMEQFQQNKQSFEVLVKQIGSQDLQIISLNKRLTLLVWKKILSNRKKLYSIVCNLITQIINNKNKFPSKVKYVVQQWSKIIKKKFGQIKYQDLKSFFVKVIFSQLLFAQFMIQCQDIRQISKNIRNFNITMIALISQKIMFGQEFYQKFKYGCFNSLIGYFSNDIKILIQGFASVNFVPVPPQTIVSTCFLSFETLKYLYRILLVQKRLPRSLPIFEQKIQKQLVHEIGSSKYPLSNIYIVFIKKPQQNFCSVFKPIDKCKRTIIQFLLLIDRIPQPTPFYSLLQQYKCSQDQSTNLRPSVQLYASYLSSLVRIHTSTITKQIIHQIETTKSKSEKIRIALQKQLNYTQNLQKYFMEILTIKKKQSSKLTSKLIIQNLMYKNLNFAYEVIDKKVCQISENKNDKDVKKCLIDISMFFRNKYQGTDGLYHLLVQKIIEDIQGQGVIDQNSISTAKEIIGKKLYIILNINQYYTQHDKLILGKMLTHSFINLTILEMNSLIQQQQLIIQLALPLLKKLQTPSSPDQLLKIFHQITIIFYNIIITTGKASDITADVQIPLMLFILIKSQLPNLPSIIDFIEKFISEQAHSTVYGQTLTLVKSAMYLIENIDAKKLNLPDQEYEKYLKLSTPIQDSSYLIIQ